MAEIKEETADVNLQNIQRNDENFSWEEWSVIGEGENGKIDGNVERVGDGRDNKENCDESDESFSDIECASDADEAKECDCVSLKNITEAECSNAENENNLLELRNDESDGISVITESESDDTIQRKNNERRVVVYHEKIQRRTTERSKENWDTFFPKVGKFVDVIIVCLLLSAIGLGSILLLTSKSNSTASKEEFESLTIEIINDDEEIPMEKQTISRFAEVSATLGNIDEILDSGKAADFKGKSLIKLPNVQTNALQEIQIFFDLLCSLMDNLPSSQDEKINRMSICNSYTPIAVILKLRQVFNIVLNKLESVEKEKHGEFLNEIEAQIEESTVAFVADLTKALHNVQKRNKNKLNKIGKKMAKKLKIFENNLPIDNETKRWLQNKSIVEYCDAISKYQTNDNSYTKKRKNATYKTSNKLNPWETRKCYDDLNNFVSKERDSKDTCSHLKPSKDPNKSKFCNSMQNTAKIMKTEQIPDKKRSKEHQKAPKISLKTNKNMKDSEERKNGRELKDDDIKAWKPTKQKKEEKEKLRTAEKRRQDFVLDTRDKKLRNYLYPSVLSIKKDRRKEETLKFFGRDPKEQNSKAKPEGNENWQFERSRGRNELRRSKGSSNWYFDRAGNRNNARESHCTDENQDPRCKNPSNL